MTTLQAPFGIKQGSFMVNQNGAANYDFSFDLPPGINGLTPKLGLTYLHNKDDGPFGVGYSLHGISQITRVGANVAIDGFKGSVNFSENDRFSLDGMRLINITSQYGASDAIYYTEINEWCHVQPGPNNKGFVALMKDGTTHEYGTNADNNSSFYSGGNFNKVRIWALNTITDAYGNTIEYTYTQNPINGSGGAALNTNENFYLQQISYSGYIVTLNYELRENIGAPIIQKYFSGEQILTSCVLSNVVVSLNGAAISNYSFTYQTDGATGSAQMISMARSDGSGDNTLPPISFSWQKTTAALEAAATIQNSDRTEQFLAIDLNGDGITDALQYYDDGNGNLIASSYIASYNSSTDTLSYSAPIVSNISFPDYKSRTYEILLANITSINTTDIIFAFSDDQKNLSFLPFWSNANGTFTEGTIISTGFAYSNIGLCSLDTDGNGVSDIVQVCWDTQKKLHFVIYKGQDLKSTSGTLPRTNVSTNFSQTRINNSNLTLLPFDVNGDGIVDMVLTYEDSGGHIAFASFITCFQGLPQTSDYFNGSTYCSPANAVSYPGNNYIFPGDANGDGVIDIIVVGTGDNTGEISVKSFLSDMTGNFNLAATSQISQQLGALNEINFYPMGFCV